MEKYSIKVNILNRPYPLLVKPEEEESVRNAARLINEKVRLYKERFSVKDDLDLVIMCCLELATDNLNQARQHQAFRVALQQKLGSIDEHLGDAILNTETAPPAR